MKIDYSEVYGVDMRKNDAHLSILCPVLRDDYLDKTPCRNHYSLLAYLSNKINNGIIVEVGSYLGVSSIALANNSSNKVITYDILPNFQGAVAEYLSPEQIDSAVRFTKGSRESFPPLGLIDRNFLPLNIEIMVKEDGNVLGKTEVISTVLDNQRECIVTKRENDPQLLLNSDLFFLDAAHDGKMEKDIYDFLVENNYRGILLLDDISLNKEMVLFWQQIKEKKYDITEVGHGIVDDLHRSGTGLVDFSGKVEVIRPTAPPPLT
jgi:hypothetical protein